MTSAVEVDRIATELRRSMVANLSKSGDLVSPRCIAAFLAVPRHVFVPRFFLDRESTGTYEVLDRTDSARRSEWLERTYSDEPLHTQVDGKDCVSSSSQPSLMAAMLEMLNLAGNERVLEIGTGTGYNAALLCEMLGGKQVTSVDIDKGLVNEAQKRLEGLGYHPMLAAVDGAGGYPEGRPYDRVIATCSMERVPKAWLAQTNKDALILLNLWRDLGGGALARLRVSEEGASGHFAPFYGGFMPTRTYEMVSAVDLLNAKREGDPVKRQTEISSAVLDNDAFGMFASLRVPAQRLGVIPEDEPEQLWLLGRDGSWAYQTHEKGNFVVVQGGPTKLWDLLEIAYDEWQELGGPPREAFGLTVTHAGGHIMWHGSPEGQTWTL